MSECRLLIDPPAPGAWNMAVDEVLHQWSAETGRCCWRFYRWSEPTLSLGYFQEYEERLRHPASERCAVVRRASGGGAILHDAELTYSFVIPLAHRLAGQRRALYEAIHLTLTELLGELGLAARLCAGHARPEPVGQPFLCFQRRADGDVVVGDVKVAGSAQRRNAGAVLQHGSVLVSRSPAAPELAGLGELLGQPLAIEEFAQRWLTKIAAALALQWCGEPLSPQELQRAEALVAARYGAEGWIRDRGRSPGRPA